jgi:5-methyltetrahydropteroyltriglutamate--homocysteine methyltransferase
MMFWFSHFIVPELGPDVKFSYASHKAVTEYKEAKAVSALVLPSFVDIFLYNISARRLIAHALIN